MTHITIRGIDIHFPYVPYKVQEDYMSKVIECLQLKANGILESPTGTGKTLSLLCSTLAWLETRKAQHQLLVVQHSSNTELADALNDLRSKVDNVAGVWNAEASSFMLPRIIYGSRTHSQLSQAIQELKRSSYKHVKAIVLGSRDQLCIHSEVSKITNHAAKLYACRSKINNKSCSYYHNVEEKIASIREYQDLPVVDIEDLVALGKKHTCCPYYAARTLKNKADIIFAPYNYIIDPKTRRSQGIELENNIIIFDEAHNIENACEESMSFQLRSVDLAMCINEISQTINIVKDCNNQFQSSFSDSPESTAIDFTLNDLLNLKVMFCELESLIDQDLSSCPPEGTSKPGDYMFDLLSKVELTPHRREVILDLLDKIILYHSNTGTSTVWGSKGAGLQKMSDMMKVFYSRFSDNSTMDFKKELAVKYRTFLQAENVGKGKSAADLWSAAPSNGLVKQSWKIDCWCFCPGLGMQDVMNHGVHSIILTSGTLSPLPPMISELGISFPVQLENPHIISDKQVLVAVVPHGPDGTPLNSSYQNRFSEKYISSLGRCISNFCRVIPNGVLVFFPSYSVMKGNIEKWEESGVWQSLSGIKPIYVEPQGKDAFQQSIEQFYSTVNDPVSKGAALLAVCRGKVSEGLDFADGNARAVIVTGLPFPPSMDPKVKLKIAYLDAVAKDTKGLRGTEWYCLQAYRAINQAIGRVIRHKSDYGVILLCDNRFGEQRNRSQLSKWVQGRIQNFNAFGPALKQVSCFFKEIEPMSHKTSNQNRIGSFSSTSQIISKNHSINNENLVGCRTKDVSPKQNGLDQNIFQSYMKPDTSKTQGSSVPTTSNPSKSVFDALSECPSTSATKLNNLPFDVQHSVEKDHSECSSSASSRVVKRRKLNVKLHHIDQPKDESMESKSNDREMWKTYLKEIKSVLGVSSNYGRFCSSVKEFRTSKHVEKFANEMKEIFMNIPEKSKFLERTSLVVNLQERKTFLSLCLEESSESS